MAPDDFLTQETERQTLTFGKWFLDRKKKNEEEKEKNNQMSPLGFELQMFRLASDLYHNALLVH